MNYFVYIIRCSDKSLYTGITVDIDRRINEHNGIPNNLKGARYTQYRRPIQLVYSANYENRSLASKEESRIKKLSKIQKEYLIKN